MSGVTKEGEFCQVGDKVYVYPYATNDINKINSVSLLKQMLTFVKKENGKKEAEQGYHDDRVMAYGIALMSRDQQKYLPENNQTEKKITWPDPLKTDDDEEYDDGNVYLRW